MKKIVCVSCDEECFENDLVICTDCSGECCGNCSAKGLCYHCIDAALCYAADEGADTERYISDAPIDDIPY